MITIPAEPADPERDPIFYPDGVGAWAAKGDASSDFYCHTS